MRCTLIRHRDQGALIPRHRQAFIHRPEGDLQVREEYAKTLGRHLLVARLLDGAGRALEGVPPLFDVQVVQITIDTILLSGYERLRDDKGVKLQDFSQTWEAKVLEAVKAEWAPGAMGREASSADG